MIKVAVDPNVLAYAEGVNAGEHQQRALDLVDRLPDRSTWLPVQVLGELVNVLVLKARRSPATRLFGTSPKVLFEAAELATSHQLRIWDAVILSVAAEGGCRLLLSEDYQDGFTWRGVTVTNPFGATQHPLLTALLAGA